MDRGAVVTDVRPTGAAARAGLNPGDVILNVQGKQIGSADEFAKALGRVGSEAVRLQVQRGSHKRFVLLKRGE